MKGSFNEAPLAKVSFTTDFGHELTLDQHRKLSDCLIVELPWMDELLYGAGLRPLECLNCGLGSCWRDD